MSKLVTLSVFDHAFDLKFVQLKAMLEEAGIGYITTNENHRSVKPALSMIPSNVSIEVKVDEKDLPDAVEILKAIS